MSKCIICGGRDFAIQQFSPNVAEKLESELRAIFTIERVDEEVCGMARGADEYGASFAKQLGIPVKEFPAYWDNTTPSPTEPVSIGVNKRGDKYNKIAGINRNRRMAEYVYLSNVCDFTVSHDGCARRVNYSKKGRCSIIGKEAVLI